MYSKELSKKSDKENPDSSLFSIPDDFFAFSNVSGVFSEGECTVTDFNMWEVKMRTPMNCLLMSLMLQVLISGDFLYNRRRFYPCV